MSEIETIRSSMQFVGRALEKAAVPYVVVGSIAGLSHGYGRSTIDIDVLAEMDDAAVAPFVEAIRGVRDETDDERYFVDDEMIRNATRQQSSFNLFDFATGLKIDIFVSQLRPFDREVMARRELETMSDSSTPAFYVQTAEDLILSKLQWFVLGNQVYDQRMDVIGLLKANQFVLDFDYLEHWAAQLKITELLQKALDEAGLKENK